MSHFDGSDLTLVFFNFPFSGICIRKPPCAKILQGSGESHFKSTCHQILIREAQGNTLVLYPR